MKFSKTSRLFLAIGIFAILLASLGVAYLQQVNQQDRLSEELSSAQLRLEKYSPEQLSSQQKQVESQLAKAQLRLKLAKANLFQSIESIEASETLFEIAQACDVEITAISSSALATEEIEGATYSGFPLTVQIEGDVSDLIDFILLWSGEYRTGVVQSEEITIPETNDEGEGESGEETEEEVEEPSANLRLFIYSYRGD